MPETAAMTNPRAGLFAGKSPIPLEGVGVDAEIRDFSSRVTITQRYRNTETHSIEAVYVFPIDETAAVSAFEAVVGETRVIGEVMEREKAFEAYDDAIAEGHGAYLLDQERADVFTASVGNVPPGSEVLVRISYVTELPLEGDDLRFVVPTTVSPRYAPVEDRKGVGRPPAEAVNPPLAWSVPYGLELDVRIEMPSAIRKVESPSHPLSVEMDGNRARVALGERRSSMDRDFVLLVGLAEPQRPRASVERNGDETIVLVSFQPHFETTTAPCEAIFLLDRSGSMGGSSIAEARNALQLCLRSLPQGSRFNLVGFGSTHEMLFPESRPYDETALREASQYVEKLEANLGGTELLPALEAVLSPAPHRDLPRQLFVLTDGQVSNTDAVIALVRKHSNTTRVFAFGIGAGASHHLVHGIARAGEGASELIFPGERIEAKVMRQLAKALSPVLTDVRVDWGGLEVEQAPYRVPPVFAGGRVLVYGFLSKAPDRERAAIRLKARTATGDLAFEVPVSFADAPSGNLIATLGARTLMRDLEEGSSPLHDRGGSLQERGGRDRVEAEAVRLGMKYGIASRWTSFVAVEKRENRVQGAVQLRKVPSELTRGWGGRLARRRVGLADMSASFATAPMPMLAFEHKATVGAARRVSERSLDRLVRLQKADGSWDLTGELAKILGKRPKALEAVPARAVGDREEARRAWATALALAWLERKAPESIDEWLLLAKKARGWLDAVTAKLPGGESWQVAAEREMA